MYDNEREREKERKRQLSGEIGRRIKRDDFIKQKYNMNLRHIPSNSTNGTECPLFLNFASELLGSFIVGKDRMFRLCIFHWGQL